MDRGYIAGHRYDCYTQSAIVMNLKVGIIGGAESGVGAALLAKHVGDLPFLSEYAHINDSYRQLLIENKISFEESGHSFDILVDNINRIRVPE